MEKYRADPVSELMLELYPSAREVMLVRDFRDMIASMFAYNEKRGRQGFRRDRASSDRDYILNDVGVKVAALADAWARRADTAHLLRYEDLVLRPEETVQALLAHLGLDAGPGAVEPMLGSLLARDSGSEGHRTVTDSRESIGRWRRDLSDEVDGCLRGGPRRSAGDLRVRAGMSGETVLLGGSVAQRPGSGGHTWVFLQYLLGLQRLGLEPVLVDWLEPEMCRDRAGAPSGVEGSWNIAYLADVMDRFGLGDSWAVLHDGGRAVLGMSDTALDRAVDRAALLLNVNGFVQQERVLERVPLRAYLDIDPGFGQMWRALDLHDPFAGHDAFVTIGERIGQPGCTIPTNGLDWVTTPQPVVLDEWPAQASRRPGRTRVHVGGQLARAVRARSSTRASPTGCACTSSGASPTCRHARRSASRWRSTSTRPRPATWSCCTRTGGICPTPRWRRPTRGPIATTCSARRGS